MEEEIRKEFNPLLRLGFKRMRTQTREKFSAAIVLQRIRYSRDVWNWMSIFGGDLHYAYF